MSPVVKQQAARRSVQENHNQRILNIQNQNLADSYYAMDDAHVQ